MNIVIHTHHKIYRSTDEHFDFKLWYVFIREGFERFSTEQIAEIEKEGGWIELDLDRHPHPDREDYILVNSRLSVNVEKT